MTLTIGTRLGPYVVTGPLGAGGMGEVYRARDTQLDRSVALKILPTSFAADPDRVMRFTREAKTLAALNHPNIAAIYGIESGPGAPAAALVMELVEGEDLSAHIARGPTPVNEVLPIARQIVDALEAAHDAGIIHRDLKPANIKLRADGTVKVLDFGLAKVIDAMLEGPFANDPGSLRNSPTFTSPAMTQMGVVLGTAAYMSPEQARGRAVDRRADIWAFGVILHELLTGRPLFAGDTTGDVMASVLKDTPDLRTLPPAVPLPLHRLLQKCLQKDPRRRLSAIGVARWELDDSGAGDATPADASRRTSWVPWAVAGIASAAAIALGVYPRASATAAAIVDGHFTITLPATAALVTSDVPRWTDVPLALSPDGRHVVYVAPSGRGTQLFVRATADPTPRPLAGTDGARDPFFSPDSQWVGFFADGKLRKILLAGGTPSTIADAPDPTGGSWGNDGEILFVPSRTAGLAAVPDGGGRIRQVTTRNLAAGDDMLGWPQVLPGTRLVLFTIIAWSRETSMLAVVDMTSGNRQVVQEDALFARYVPGRDGSGGHIVFVRDGALVAASFDPARPAQLGSAVTVLEGVRQMQFDVSRSGTLVYAPASGKAPDYSLVWADRTGAVTSINDLPRGYEDLSLSRDGKRVALTVEESGPDSPAYVWIADVDRRALTRLTFDHMSRDPVFAPDSQSLVFGSKRGADQYGLYVQRLDGRSSAELVWESPVKVWPDATSWTQDGRTIVFTTNGNTTSDDIWTLSLDDRKARPWLNTGAVEGEGRLSPNSRWMAYASDESGRTEVYVQPFPGPGAKHLVSQRGGRSAIWSQDGRELFYRRGDELMVVAVETGDRFTSGTPAPMFSGRFRSTGRDYDVSPDGRRFVLMHAIEPRTTDRMAIILNWWSLLDARR
jgi:eukaryotic-like serine/threonine-protein kinase